MHDVRTMLVKTIEGMTQMAAEQPNERGRLLAMVEDLVQERSGAVTFRGAAVSADIWAEIGPQWKQMLSMLRGDSGATHRLVFACPAELEDEDENEVTDPKQLSLVKGATDGDFDLADMYRALAQGGDQASVVSIQPLLWYSSEHGAELRFVCRLSAEPSTAHVAHLEEFVRMACVSSWATNVEWDLPRAIEDCLVDFDESQLRHWTARG